MGREKSSPEDPVEAALDRVRSVCLGFPGAEEKLSHGAPSFHVKGKMFLMFVDDHHSDGRLAVWCKAALESQCERVASDPIRFFVPPYVGVKGWVGVRLDVPTSDWIELAILVEEGWGSIAPKRLARDPGARPQAPPPKPPPRPKTDKAVARAALERLTALCLALPEATCESQARHASFRVKKKVFAYFLDNHHGEGTIVACVKSTKAMAAKLIASDPKRFTMPAYIGARGWVGVRLDRARVDWKDVAERVRASYASVAPKKLALLV